MAKIEKASQDVVNLFSEIRDKSTIPHWIQFEVLCNNKQKELYKIVKTNDIVEILTDGVNFAVVFNEEILEQLPVDLQEMAITECLAGVSVSESDAVSLVKPDFNTYTGVLQKYGDSSVIVLHESIKSLFDSKKQKEDEEKAATKGKRGRKKGVFDSN
jgi:hypothetical protein